MKEIKFRSELIIYFLLNVGNVNQEQGKIEISKLYWEFKACLEEDGKFRDLQQIRSDFSERKYDKDMGNNVKMININE